MIQKVDAFLAAAVRAPVVPVLVVPSVDCAIPLARTLIEGGLTIAEITLRTEAGLKVIEAMKKAEPSLVVGAGTVLNGRDASASVSAGADFLVSPGMTSKLLRELGPHDSIMIPGIATASEAMARQEDGFRVLKLFPAAAAGGVQMLKGLAGPLPDLSFMPTGGVSEANAGDYLSLKNVCAIGGSWLASAEEMAAGEWAKISARVKVARAMAI